MGSREKDLPKAIERDERAFVLFKIDMFCLIILLGHENGSSGVQTHRS